MSWRDVRRGAAVAIALLVALGLVVAGDRLAQSAGGRALAFALLVGAALGVVLQRSRFCFYCHARDWLDDGDARGLVAILVALAVGTVGMHVVLSAWVPVPTSGRLPPDAHVGPVSAALVLAGIAFGLGMVVSGSCISAHWYRLGEGSPVAPFALLGSALGFVVGFNTWNPLYGAFIVEAPVTWLPGHVGYLGSASASLATFGLLAAFLLARGRRPDAPEAPPPTQSEPAATRSAVALPTHRQALARVFDGRWPYWLGGLLVGWIATLVVLRLRPLGVTAALGGAVRDAAQPAGLVPTRLEALDGFGGCATLPDVALWRSPNALLIVGLVLGAFAAALLSGQFKPRLPTAADAARGLGGGVLLGWGAMTALGCTVGTLLSGTMAGAASGWVFGISVFVGLWSGHRLGWSRAVPVPRSPA